VNSQSWSKPKRHLNVAAARQLAYATVEQKLPLIVIAADATADARELLRSSGIGLIDGGGHAHIELPNLLLHVAEPCLRARTTCRKISRPKVATADRPRVGDCASNGVFGLTRRPVRLAERCGDDRDTARYGSEEEGAG
jgi:hypothetical protein